MCTSCLSAKSVITGLIILIFISLLSQFINNNPNLINTPTKITPTIKIATSSPQFAKVVRAIDGDTIEIENKQKVRYIGINTPELHDPRKPVQCFAEEAYEENKRLIEGKTVHLERDVSETDKYGRLLRYVYLDPSATSEAVFVNDYLVQKGYATAATYPPDVKFSKTFVQSQRQAEINNLGLWQNCPN